MNRPERLEIVTDKPDVPPGETAQVLIRSPLPGTLLLTLETDRCLVVQVAEVTENTAELSVPAAGRPARRGVPGGGGRAGG